MTPRQYAVLMERHREKEEHQGYRSELAAAIVAHAVATFAGKQLKEGTKPVYADFMPSQQQKLASRRRAAMAESVRDFLHGLAKSQGLA